MALNTSNVRVYGDITNRVTTAILGTTAITSPLLSALPTGYYDLGWITDDGLSQGTGVQETKKYGWQGNSIIRVIRSQFERTFTFAAAEENATVLGLAYPGVTPSTAGATAEVQTVTITGSPTGGTFTLTLAGYGSTAALAYNAPTATVAAALTALVGGTVGVSGTPGTSYVTTFPSSLGNIVTLQAGAAFTGGTSPAIGVVTTTPGVNGITTRAVTSTGAQNLRQWGLYASDGAYQKCYYVPNGEAVLDDDIQLQGTDETVFKYVLNTYPDTNGVFFYEISNNPNVGSGLFV